jgi:hypothetical protein
MQESTARKLRFLALQLVGAVAVIHLIVGLDQVFTLIAAGVLGRYLTGEFLTYPRALLFVLSGGATLAGIVAVGRGKLSLRTAYLLGIAMLLTYFLGWVAWHTVLDHGAVIGAAPGSEETGHTHDGLVDMLTSHYFEPMVAVFAASGSGQPGTGKVLLGIASKTLELVGIGVLLTLLRGDPRVEGGLPDPRRWFALERPD